MKNSLLIKLQAQVWNHFYWFVIAARIDPCLVYLTVYVYELDWEEMVIVADGKDHLRINANGESYLTYKYKDGGIIDIRVILSEDESLDGGNFKINITNKIFANDIGKTHSASDIIKLLYN